MLGALEAFALGPVDTVNDFRKCSVELLNAQASTFATLSVNSTTEDQ
jgi:hypothetical protein